jgi:hypothetical protein
MLTMRVADACLRGTAMIRCWTHEATACLSTRA